MPAGLDKKIKLLLLKLNMQGHDVSLIKEQRYSKEFNSIYSRYKLTFWIKGMKKNKRTGEVKEANTPDTHEFNNQIELLKYMVVRVNERETKNVC
jgi:hypothetical protein